MTLDEFDFDLPQTCIARRPAANRDDARLLVYDRAHASREHRGIRNFPDFLRSGDVLVLNDTRVIPARILLRRQTGGAVEGLVVRVDGDDLELLSDGGGRLRPADVLSFENDTKTTLKLGEKVGSVWRARIDGGGPDWLARLGRVPLPPYIRKSRRHAGESDSALESEDRERYQTVFASSGAAVAAPTAGLHFTEELLNTIKSRGARIVTIRLDVGPGTFAPIRDDNISGHKIEPEAFSIGAESAEIINKAKNGGFRVVAVGTTVVRTLEFASDASGRVGAGSGSSDLFIRPGYKFKVVDSLMTNFHLPKSTLFMLVCAFAGTETVMELYKEAVREQYRFYSYGDATFFI
ncbi:MAG: tRNA preQ1(34) S-adenosylmethionine ribosyltransferase-isomerase QueA [Planctomycetes bacterium]|nr:tRNA preQ1(34) S-adenosylmethionine ribosyltransferase-isomerase QueA [Planctomycetota bacterium]